LTTGEPFVASERGERRRDRGMTEFYDWRIDRILLPDGGHGVACYFRDVSAQVKSRLAITDSEERYRTLAESLEEQVRIGTQQLEQRSDELVKQSEALRTLSMRLMQTQDEERRHIARDLHECAGQSQTLAALVMILSQINRETKSITPEVARLVNGWSAVPKLAE
jgi:signal transduction histidine kinase